MIRQIFIILLLIPIAIFAQNTVIETTNTNQLYCGIDNPIKIAVTGFPCEHILLKCNNKNIEIAGKNCSYKVKPKIVGIAHFEIINSLDFSLIDSFNLKIKRVPEPEFKFHSAGFEGAQLYLDYIIIQNEIWDNFGINYKIKEFQVFAKRDSMILFDLINEGQYFNENIKSRIKELKVGDKLYLGKIILQVEDFEIQYNGGICHKFF